MEKKKQILKSVAKNGITIFALYIGYNLIPIEIFETLYLLLYLFVALITATAILTHHKWRRKAVNVFYFLYFISFGVVIKTWRVLTIIVLPLFAYIFEDFLDGRS